MSKTGGDRMLDLILSTFKELIHVQTQLIDYAKRKKESLIERQIDTLNQIVSVESKLIKQFVKLENIRIEQVDCILKGHPSLTFRQYIETIEDEELKEKVLAQIDQLQEGMLELQLINKNNDQLLKDSIQFVHHMISHVTQSKQQQFNYQSPLGQKQTQHSSRGFFDTKA